jgi:hypothetical protein
LFLLPRLPFTTTFFFIELLLKIIHQLEYNFSELLNKKNRNKSLFLTAFDNNLQKKVKELNERKFLRRTIEISSDMSEFVNLNDAK